MGKEEKGESLEQRILKVDSPDQLDSHPARQIVMTKRALPKKKKTEIPEQEKEEPKKMPDIIEGMKVEYFFGKLKQRNYGNTYKIGLPPQIKYTEKRSYHFTQYNPEKGIFGWNGKTKTKGGSARRYKTRHSADKYQKPRPGITPKREPVTIEFKLTTNLYKRQSSIAYLEGMSESRRAA